MFKYFTNLPYELQLYVIALLPNVTDLSPLTCIPYFRPILNDLVLYIDLEHKPDLFLNDFTESIVRFVPNILGEQYKFVIFRLRATNDELFTGRTFFDFASMKNLPNVGVYCSIDGFFYQFFNDLNGKFVELFKRPYEFNLTSIVDLVYLPEARGCTVYISRESGLSIQFADGEFPPTVYSDTLQKLHLGGIKNFSVHFFDNFHTPNLNSVFFKLLDPSTVNSIDAVPDSVQYLTMILRTPWEISTSWSLADTITAENIYFFAVKEEEQEEIELGPVDYLKIPQNTKHLCYKCARPDQVEGIQNVLTLRTNHVSMLETEMPNLEVLLLEACDTHYSEFKVNAPNLKSLRIKGPQEWDATFNTPKLTHLATNVSLLDVCGIPFENVIDLFMFQSDFQQDYYDDFKQLKTLTMRRCWLDDLDIHYLKNLETLSLIDCRLSNELFDEHNPDQAAIDIDMWKLLWKGHEKLKTLEIILFTCSRTMEHLMSIWETIENLTVHIHPFPYGDNILEELIEFEFPCVTGTLKIVSLEEADWWPSFEWGILHSTMHTLDISYCDFPTIDNEKLLIVPVSVKKLILEKSCQLFEYKIQYWDAINDKLWYADLSEFEITYGDESIDVYRSMDSENSSFPLLNYRHHFFDGLPTYSSF